MSAVDVVEAVLEPAKEVVLTLDTVEVVLEPRDEMTVEVPVDEAAAERDVEVVVDLGVKVVEAAVAHVREVTDGAGALAPAVSR